MLKPSDSADLVFALQRDAIVSWAEAALVELDRLSAALSAALPHDAYPGDVLHVARALRAARAALAGLTNL